MAEKDTTIPCEAQENVLRMSDISKVFGGVIALNKAQLDLHKGEIHAVIGENGAGKSTLFKILLGLHKKDGGEIYHLGKKVEYASPEQALNAGISMIHQEVSLVQQMTVAENIWLGREKRFYSGGLLSPKKRLEATRALMEEMDISLDPNSMVGDLRISEMQLVELMRAVSYDPNIIVMDEPTSALTDKEVEALFVKIRKLAANGVAIVFISHKLEELFQICDTVTVMRDGHFIRRTNIKEISVDELIQMMTGRDMSEAFSREMGELGPVKLEVKHIANGAACRDVSFSVRSGEVIGFCGLVGAGRSETLRAIFGIDKREKGEIYVNGEKVDIQNPADAIRLGIGMVTEDRLRMGAVYTLSVMKNATLAVFSKLCNKLGYCSPKSEFAAYREKADELSIKTSSPDALISELSGGNQQKVILERWLLTDSEILFLDEPTRGIDVGSKREIYALIDKFAAEGKAVVVVSSELPELFYVCDRILVMHEGRMTPFSTI